MIVAERRGEDVVVSAELAQGAVAYVDADWLPQGRTAEVPALVAREGRLVFADEESVAIPEGVDPDTAAARALMQVASAAVAALEAREGAVEVVGRGAVADLARRLVASRDGPISAVVEVSGDPAAIRDALDRLPPAGTLVVAGETLQREVAVDLYATIHLRGLRVVGVAPPLAGGALYADGIADLPLVPPAVAASGEPVASGALWFRIAG